MQLSTTIHKAVCILLIMAASISWSEDEETATTTTIASYVKLEPDFTINYGDIRRTRYIVAALSLRVMDNTKTLQVTEHDDAIRHALIMLFSEQPVEQLRSTEGRNEFLTLATERLQALMVQETGDPLIDMVLFTSFIMQP